MIVLYREVYTVNFKPEAIVSLNNKNKMLHLCRSGSKHLCMLKDFFPKLSKILQKLFISFLSFIFVMLPLFTWVKAKASSKKM